MHPLYRHRFAQQSAALVHQFRPKEQHVVDAPTPWRTVRYFSELDEILDAKGFTVAVCRPEHAARIIAAVNGVERAT